MRFLRFGLLIAFLLLVAGILITWPSLDCAHPAGIWGSPDSGATLTVCRRPNLFPTMPGQGSDASGYVILRVGGRLAGVVGLELIASVDRPPEWTMGHVSIPLVAEFDVPTARPSLGADLLWQVRAGLGLIPQSAQFH